MLRDSIEGDRKGMGERKEKRGTGRYHKRKKGKKENYIPTSYQRMLTLRVVETLVTLITLSYPKSITLVKMSTLCLRAIPFALYRLRTG